MSVAVSDDVCSGRDLAFHGATAVKATDSVLVSPGLQMADPASVAKCSGDGTFRVKEINTQNFLPPDATSESRQFEEQFAEYVASGFAVLTAIQSNMNVVMTMGLAAPFAFAAIWFVLLFAFIHDDVGLHLHEVLIVLVLILGDVIIIGKDSPTIAVTAKRLCREKAGAGHMRERTNLAMIQGGTKTLCSIVEEP